MNRFTKPSIYRSIQEMYMDNTSVTTVMKYWGRKTAFNMSTQNLDAATNCFFIIGLETFQNFLRNSIFTPQKIYILKLLRLANLKLCSKSHVEHQNISAHHGVVIIKSFLKKIRYCTAKDSKTGGRLSLYTTYWFTSIWMFFFSMVSVLPLYPS